MSLNALFYPRECNYTNFWNVPGTTLDTKGKTYIDCEVTKARVNAIFGAVIIVILMVVLFFIPVDKWWWKLAVAGGGITLLIITGLSALSSGYFAQAHVDQMRNEYETWVQDQPPANRNLGAFMKYKAPQDTTIEAARIMGPRSTSTSTETALAAGVGSFLATALADYKKKK